jgi:ribonucleoside-diphosphate reductase alpha chain
MDKLVGSLQVELDETGMTEDVLRHYAARSSEHPDYARLSGRIAAVLLHERTPNTFGEAMDLLQAEGVLQHRFVMAYTTHRDALNAIIRPERDRDFDIFGWKTLERAYLLKAKGKIVERPQYMYLRVAVGIHGIDLKSVEETYNDLSLKRASHATPTMFNAGCRYAQCASCFLLGMKSDSIDGIYETLQECAQISKYAGGIGLWVHNIRAKGTPIRGTNGVSNGIVPMLKVFNQTARYVDQGGGRRKGSFAIYIEPWHADVEAFLDLKKNQGSDDLRARDLFYALWIPDLFMRRVKNDEVWSLMCPHKCPGLSDVHSAAFDDLYVQYEAEGRWNKQIKAQELWKKILDVQVESGTPYLVYKDACNRKSNQQNLGTIKSSNLCAEIVQYSDERETAVCNLASVSLPACIVNGAFDFNALQRITRRLVYNLNRLIDLNVYPTPNAKTSNLKHRPIGIGVQGLADVFHMLQLPFDCEETRVLNKRIFEHLYYACVDASCSLAEEKYMALARTRQCSSKFQGAYTSFKGSPMSRGLFQFDLWDVIPTLNWEPLRQRVRRFGIRNSELTAIMPTASTSSIVGNNECCEPYTSNLFTRRVLSGEFIMLNRHLVKALAERDLWNSDVQRGLIQHRGSVQTMEIVPEDLKKRFLTVWEMSMKSLIDMAADRGPYISQSQSLNLFVSTPSVRKCSSMHFYAHEKGLKTGCYYLRSLPAANAVPVTVEPCTMCSA